MDALVEPLNKAILEIPCMTVGVPSCALRSLKYLRTKSKTFVTSLNVYLSF